MLWFPNVFEGAIQAYIYVICHQRLWYPFNVDFKDS